MQQPDSFAKAIPGESHASQVGRFRVKLWRSIPPLLLFSLTVGVLSCTEIHAQVRDKRLSGIVKSPLGAPVANARVLIKNTSNSEMKSMTVSSTGTFALTDLAPGTYEIT